MSSKKRLIVVLGPTASGKTGLSLRLAKKFRGEIISADSRQVYKGLDIGTGKITEKEMRGIPHHLLDITSPKRKFTVAKYQKLALLAINKINKRGCIPILVGGTGFYIQAVVDGILIPKVKPDWKLRKKLEKKSVGELFLLLKQLDPVRAKNIDINNPRRLIRALEIIIKTKKPILPIRKSPPKFEVLMLGIKKSPAEINKLIKKRLLKRLKQGLVKEVKNLRKGGLSWKRFDELGLEYRFVAQYLLGKLTYKKMVSRLQKEIEHYAKRQMTWFKKDKRVKWIKNQKQAETLVSKFL